MSEASLCASLQNHCSTLVLCRKGAVDRAFTQSFGLTDVKEFTPFEVIVAWTKRGHWLNSALKDVDVLHVNGHWKWENLLLALLCRRRGTPYVLHPRGMLWLGHRKVFLKKVFNALLGNYFIRRAAKVIALSEFEKTQWISYRLPSQKVVVIPNGVQKVHSSDRPDELAFPYFLYFGRLESRKNLIFLLKAFASYVHSGGKAKLVLMGPVERGYDTQLHNEVLAENLSQNVLILPPVYGSKKYAYLQHATAVVYPSVGEPFGRVPFETLAAGSLPVVPDESGSSEYLRPLLPFATYPVIDSHRLVKCFTDIERLAPDVRRRYQDQARTWVEKNLDWELITQKTLLVYGEAVLPGAQRPGLVQVY